MHQLRLVPGAAAPCRILCVMQIQAQLCSLPSNTSVQSAAEMEEGCTFVQKKKKVHFTDDHQLYLTTNTNKQISAVQQTITAAISNKCNSGVHTVEEERKNGNISYQDQENTSLLLKSTDRQGSKQYTQCLCPYQNHESRTHHPKSLHWPWFLREYTSNCSYQFRNH